MPYLPEDPVLIVGFILTFFLVGFLLRAGWLVCDALVADLRRRWG